MNCKKCNESGTVILRKKDTYCENCFISNTNHKFRACIGKNKILSANEKVLVCLSEGAASLVLLHLIHSGTFMDNHKKLRIIPYFLHIIDSTHCDFRRAINVIEQCKKYNFNIYVTHISEYMTSDTKLPEMNCLPQINKENADQFLVMLKSMPPTASNDLLQKVKRNRFIRFARLLQCNYIFTAETTTTLAIHLLSNLALGRGSQIESDVGFCDARNDDIRILRPMKDISKEELDYYISIKQLVPGQQSELRDNSLQSVIRMFVTDLQESFQATISTVCKTADKISVQDDNNKELTCFICKSQVGADSSKLTALQATNISRTVSHGPQNHDYALSNTEGDKHMPEELHVIEAVFPLIHKKLCYGCSRNYSEMDKSNLPSHIQNCLED